jgi:neutral ceramidase
MRLIGEREYGAASQIFATGANTQVRGDVDVRHLDISMPGLLVATNERNGAGQSTLCAGAYGFSFAAGAEDGPSGVGSFHEGMRFEEKNAAGWANLASVFQGSLVP